MGIFTRIAVIAMAILCLAACERTAESLATPEPVTLSNVGSNTCASCHDAQFRDWQSSHHALAMQEANGDTVLGDFSAVQFEYFDTTSTFLRQNDQFIVRTQNAAGELQDFPVKYTFGVTPLQQYLIELPRGHVQALSIAWDDRSVDEGGQRWFHLYPDELIAHDDELHWTGRTQNWNYQCAECHSTELEKNYNLESDSFATDWSEINVGCEGCHGPGSRHVQQAQSGTLGSRAGFVIDLDDAGRAVWEINPATGIAERSEFRTRPPVQPEACGRCHSRRSNITPEYEFGKSLLDTHAVSLLDQGLYYPDGQISEEVYVYGSFLQSRMYQAGVSCSDCHNPHSGELKTGGQPSNVCSTCHAPDTFATTAHHKHELDAVECVDCHMASKTYMGVDDRRDHSFRIPRPDLTSATGSPNACNGCHVEQDADWADAAITRWFGDDRPGHYGPAIHAAREGVVRANEQLLQVIGNEEFPGIVRGTALSELRGPYSPEVASAIQAGIASPDPLVRIGALRSLPALQPELRAQWGGPLLADPIRAVRIEAVRVLSSARSVLHLQYGAAFREAETELISSLQANSEHPTSHTNLGNHYITAGDFSAAEAVFRTGLRLDSRAVGSRVNLADLYRQQGRDDDAEALIREGLELNADDAGLRHSLGLLLVRSDRSDEALTELEAAAGLQPDNPRFAFVYGVALNSLGRQDEAVAVLTGAAERFPADFDIHWGLATMLRDMGRTEEATVIAEAMVERYPGVSSIVNLLISLR